MEWFTIYISCLNSNKAGLGIVHLHCGEYNWTDTNRRQNYVGYFPIYGDLYNQIVSVYSLPFLTFSDFTFCFKIETLVIYNNIAVLNTYQSRHFFDSLFD